MEKTDNKLSMSQTTPECCLINVYQIRLNYHSYHTITLHTPFLSHHHSSHSLNHSSYPPLLTSSPPSPTHPFSIHHHSILTPPSFFTLQGRTLQSVVRGWTWRMGRRGAPSHRTLTWPWLGWPCISWYKNTLQTSWGAYQKCRKWKCCFESQHSPEML